FFFQAEDGIRDRTVTGVQTCALPISPAHRFHVLRGILPIDPAQVSVDVVAGVTLAALAIPEVMGYTAISGTPVVTGLYTILLPKIGRASCREECNVAGVARPVTSTRD